jgi:prevent-host-death family protein
MRDQDPRTQTMKISDIKNQLFRLVNAVYRQETRVLVEKAGIPVAALVSAEDLKQLARLDAQRAERRRVIAAMREPFRGVPPEEIARETAAAVAEVREELRQERAAAARP